MVDQPEPERRIYVLPPDLLNRLRAYQAAEGLPSEVEAVRRLLDTALQMRDTVGTILESLKTRQAEERDLKVLAKEVVGHALVESVEVKGGALMFKLSTGDVGQIDRNGRLAYGDNEHNLNYYTPSDKQSKTMKSDLEDEIPF